MGLNVKVGTLTQPGSTGQQTYDLAVNFGVKALLLWAVNRASDGTTTSSDPAAMAFGAATYRSATARAWYSSIFGESGDQAVAHYANGIGEGLASGTPVLKLYGPDADVDPPNVDLSITFVSFGLQGGSSDYDRFTLDWTNLHTTASILVCYMALGGSDITDAQIVGFFGSDPTTTQDVTVETGFGQPDLILLGYGQSIEGDFGGTNGDADPNMMFSWAKSDTERMSTTMRFDDGVGTMAGAAWQRAALFSAVTLTAEGDAGDLAAKANWPTDGFRISWSNPSVDFIACLALKGTFNSKIGTITNPTAGSPPVSQDADVGFVPKGVFFFGNVLPTSTSFTNSHADLGTIHLGAYDGTNEVNTFWSDDNGSVGAARTRVGLSQTKGLRFLTNAAGTMTTKAEADVSFVGNAVRQSWTTIDASVARETAYIAFGDATPPVSFMPAGRRG